MRILFLGDLVGSIGISAASDFLPFIKKEKGVDFVIVNGENASSGKGLLFEDYRSIAMFADAITLGNHYHAKGKIDAFITSAASLVRPVNLKNYTKGLGSRVFRCKGVPIRVTNILGEAFMKEEVTKPIPTFESFLEKVDEPIHIVDYHGESTSEKQIFAYSFDGVITAVIGTHTHVPTLDARILPKGSAYQSDAGYCGAYDSIIGFDVDSTIDRMVYNLGRLAVPNSGRRVVYGTIVDVDENDMKAKSIEAICYLDGKELPHGPRYL